MLTLALRPQGDNPLATMITALSGASEPASLTLSQLRRWPVVPEAGTDIYVFENPSIVAEAAARNWISPPIVCSSGWPNVAVLTLLRQLKAGGATLFLHADHDPKGLGIVQLLAERVGGTPWNMPPAPYTTLHSALPDDGDSPAVTGGTAETLASLGRRSVHEENVRCRLPDEIRGGR